MIHWLRLCAPSPGVQGLIPGLGTLIDPACCNKLKEPKCCNQEPAHPNKHINKQIFKKRKEKDPRSTDTLTLPGGSGSGRDSAVRPSPALHGVLCQLQGCSCLSPPLLPSFLPAQLLPSESERASSLPPWGHGGLTTSVSPRGPEVRESRGPSQRDVRDTFWTGPPGEQDTCSWASALLEPPRTRSQ